MTHRFRAALVLVVVLAVGAIAIWLVLGGGGEKPPGESGEVEPRPIDTDVPGGDPRLMPGGTGADVDPSNPTGARPLTPGGDGLPPSRTPEGPDYTDRETNQRLLKEALGDRPIDWQRVKQLLNAYDGKLDDDVLGALLKELQTGNRAGALEAFSVLKDGTAVREILGLLDRQGLTAGARNAMLQALASMPGANDAEVVHGLEARLTGSARKDLLLLQAIGKRGGQEAARAIVEYLLRSGTPLDLPNYGFLGLNLQNDATAREIVENAYGQATSPEALRALIRLSAQAGAGDLVDSLIALDGADQPTEVRNDVLAAIGRIGSKEGVDYLLRVGAQPGQYGETALRSVGRIKSATPEARAALVQALADADRNPRPDVAKGFLLQALGTLREPAALPAMLESMRSGSAEVRGQALRGLGRLGEVARPHVEDLVQVFSEGDEVTQQHVVIALAGIGGEKAIGALKAMQTAEGLSPQVKRTVDSAVKLARENAAASSEGSSGSTTGLRGTGGR